MKYQIYRTSDWFGEEKPCQKAYKEIGDIETISDWYINIDTLEQLQELIEEVDTVVLSKTSIEIYDTYRE